MSAGELEFYSMRLRELDTVNRSYTWRIIYDHVKMGKLAPSKFLETVLRELPAEPIE